MYFRASQAVENIPKLIIMDGLVALEHIPRLLEQNKVRDSIQRAILTLWVQDEEAQNKYIVGKQLNSSLNARAFFNSASPVVRKGNNSPIVDADVWRLDEENTASHIWSRIEPEWEAEKAKPE